MQNRNKDGQSPLIGRLGQSESDIHSRTLSSAGRRRTQEQGQGDLDDDWQDTTPAAAQEEVDPGELKAEGS